MSNDPNADDRDIRNLISQMAIVTDGGDLDTYGSMLLPDTTWQMPGAPLATGRDAIVENARNRRATGGLGPGSHTRHLVSTVRIVLDGDSATGQACWQFWGDTASAPVLRAMGRYEDTFRRTSDGWKYASRTAIVD
jgi:ketosteroid isomerase-like protein